MHVYHQQNQYIIPVVEFEYLRIDTILNLTSQFYTDCYIKDSMKGVACGTGDAPDPTPVLFLHFEIILYFLHSLCPSDQFHDSINTTILYMEYKIKLIC